MSTARKLIEDFIYPHIDFITELAYKDGEDTVFMGIRALDDKEKFTHGTLVNAAATLFTYYEKHSDPRADEILKRLHFFIGIAASSICKTWGKIAILRAFNTLYEGGLIDRVDKEYLELVKSRTEYDDFFDKEMLTLKGYATNYYQVAMACAGYREKLGWESEGYAAKIAEKLAKIMESNPDGWMDDEIPYGRFDRYSLVIASEFADTAQDIGIEIPKVVRDNLARATDAIMFMANASGHGITYGRSVACHGDSTGVEVISSALADGIIPEGDIPKALAYSMRILRRIVDFWFDKEKRSFNIWYGGRSTNRYRSMGRIFEVNLDMTNHLYVVLKNLERAALADTEVDERVSEPECWQLRTVDFIEKEGDIKSLALLRRGELTVFLPFVGLGRAFGRRAAYHSFPAIPTVIEASPVAEYPFMLPEYTDAEGVKYRPCQYFSNMTSKSEGDRVHIHVDGSLSVTNDNVPARSPYSFSLDYVFEGREISVTVKSDVPCVKAEMVTGAVKPTVRIETFGFDSTEALSTEGDGDYDAISASLTNVRLHKGDNAKELGYMVMLE